MKPENDLTDTEIKQLYAHRSDPDEWENEPADVQVRPNATEVVSFRLPSQELDRLQAAAEDRNQSLSQFIRESIQKRLEGRALTVVEDLTSAAKAYSWLPVPEALVRESQKVGLPTIRPILRTSRAAKVCVPRTPAFDFQWSCRPSVGPFRQATRRGTQWRTSRHGV